MRWWMLGLLAPMISLSCGDSSKSGGPDGRAGATSGGASGSAGRMGDESGGASGTAGTAAAAGVGAGGTSGTSGGTGGSGATGGVGPAGSGGTAGDGGAGAGGGGAAGDAGAGGEAGDSGDDTFHAQSIDGGGNHSCALLDTGGVLCWGSSSDGQAGGSGSRLAPVALPITDVVQLSAGSFHTCAVQASGNVKCWGQDLFGAIGNGVDNLDDKPSPVDVIDLEDAIAVAAGGAHTCALVRGGTVKCWGDDWEGQLGNGSDGEMGHPSPVDVENLTNAIAITAGRDHTCAIIEGGTVSCWGDNLRGQLGVGAVGGILRSPMDVPGVDEVVALQAGTWHTCALRANGAVLCWGTDAYGQLGDGDDDEADEPSPVAVMTASGATSIALGDVHTCATLVGGMVQCWGRDNDGQIGDGDDGQQDQMSAADVVGLEGAVAVSVGFGHTCALGETGQVHCWGRDMDGQVGNGDDGQADKLAPVVVQGF